MKVYNKFVESKKEPYNKNDIWFDGEVFNIYKEGRWQAFTFRVSDAEAVIRIVREFVAYYNDDIKPTVQEAQEAASRIETYISLAIEATETSTRNNELFIELNAQLAELFNELQSLIDASNTATSSAQEAASLANSQATLAQQATQETIEATVNANNAINTINTLLETLEETINNKVDKIPGKGLSTNDFTDEDKGKLYKLETQIESQDALIKDLQGGKANKEGNYPSLRVGTADTAIDLAGRGESVPAEFGFRASGGKSIKDGRAYIKRIKGNSVVWNQLYPTGWSVTREGITTTSQNNIITANGTLTATYFGSAQIVGNEVNHKYLFIVEGLSSAFNGANFSLQNRPGNGAVISNGFAYFFYDNSDPSLGRNIGFSRLTLGAVISETYILRQIDLTKMFGAGNEPTTIEEFYARIPQNIDLNAYNEGEVIHMNTESIKSVGDNAWDGSLFDGYVNDDTGAILRPDISGYKSTGFVRVLPNTQYYIRTDATSGRWGAWYDKDQNYISGIAGAGIHTSPSNAAYMRMTIAYNNDGNPDTFGIYLVHSGWKQDTDAGYQPYWQDTLPLPIIRKYFPNGMKSAGSAHDEIRYNKASGKWEAVQRFREETEEDFKVSFVNTQQDGGNIFSVKVANLKVPNTDIERMSGLLSNRYGQATRTPNLAQMADKTMIRFQDGNIYIKDSSYSDASEFKKNLTIVYEIAEPIVTELDAEDQNFRDYYNVADFGTEMSQSNVPSAAFSADIIYQFNAVDMIREHEIEITELQSIITEQQSVIATMQAQLASLTSNY